MKSTQFKLIPLTIDTVVYDKIHKSFGTVIDDFSDPINGDRGEIRLDSDGMCAMFEYDTKHNLIGYALIRIQDMTEKELLAACKEAQDHGHEWPYPSTVQKHILYSEVNRSKTFQSCVIKRII
jgi:hypothetical protein